MENMKYWFYISGQYIKKNLSRTLYSIFGIMVTYILCFSIFTVGYSVWEYSLQLCYLDVEAQLFIVDQSFSKKEIAALKALEQEGNVKEITVFDNSVWVNMDAEEDITAPKISVDEMDQLADYSVYVNLKDTSNLQKSASEIEKEYQLTFRVDSDVEMFLNQGDSLERSAYSAIVAIVGAVFAVFSIMIIRNTMTISVVERMRDYGLFRCVGMSKGQLYRLLLTEGAIMSIFASLLGTGCGFGVLKIFERWFNSSRELEAYFSFGLYPKAILYSFFLMIGVTLFALLEPARQASVLSPIDAIHNNIVLRKKNGKLKEKISFHRGGLWGKIYGVSGEYAYKNMQRNRGRFLSISVTLCICVALIVSVQSFLDSFAASFSNIFQGKNQECFEYISMEGKYDQKIAEQIDKDLESYKGVQGTTTILGKMTIFFEDPLLKKQSEKNENDLICYQYAYDEKHINQLKDYLLEGKISYGDMVEKNEVLLCDLQYNVSDLSTDYNQEDIRITDYQVGDKISFLSVRGKQKAGEAFEKAIAQVAKKYHIPATQEEARKLSTYAMEDDEEKGIKKGDIIWPTALEVYSEEEKDYEKYRNEVWMYLKQSGYDIPEKKMKETVYINNMISILRQMEFDAGEKEEFTIAGIISEDIFNGYVQSQLANRRLLLIHPQENAISEYMERMDSKEKASWMDFSDEWCWNIGVIRNIDAPDEAIKIYCQENAYSYGSVIDESEFQYYTDMIQLLETVQIISWIVGAAISLICFVQILNTLYANLAMRKKELWLYTVVGMSRKQRMKMLLLEHTLAVIIGVLLGYLTAWGISWYSVEYLLNQDGTIQYVWSWSRLLPIGGIVCAVIVFVCVWGIWKNEMKQ